MAWGRGIDQEWGMEREKERVEAVMVRESKEKEKKGFPASENRERREEREMRSLSGALGTCCARRGKWMGRFRIFFYFFLLSFNLFNIYKIK